MVAALYTVLGIGTAAVAPLIGPMLPPGLGGKLGSDAVEAVLSVLASSMLTVVTFSLGIMVQAFAAASGTVTPRATELLKSDRTTQRVLSAFLGSFLFSLIGIIALNAGLYSENDRLVLFVATILVVILIVIAILRWIAHLTVFGLMDDTIRKVEDAARDALDHRMDTPFLGGHEGAGPPPGARAVHHAQIGYLVHLDMPALQALADDAGVDIHLAVLPGSFLHPGLPAMWITHQGTSDTAPEDEALCNAMTITENRTYDQDPRFGLTVLTEIAERALSPAVNDPGTAIDILGRSVRLLATCADPRDAELEYARIWVPALSVDDLLDDVFPPIARDGAAIFAVQMRLQKSLLALAQIAPDRFAAAARHQSAEAMARCRDQMLSSERDRLDQIVQAIAATG
ncbi:DUF2254 domain-containing protein [Paracoccus sp. Ld10]|uniref:DUF2254 domain-containing protein n=1 Tax=Paracoccus sp. Ld10 TaxID=649158 RepID=UPI003868C1E9